MTAPRPRLLVIGPTPPPHHGISTFMERFLVAPELHAAFVVSHLDNADRRDLENIGRFDLRNVALALQHIAQLVVLLVRRRPQLVYFEVSQNAWAYLRDAFFIVLPKLFGARVAVRLNGSDFRNFYDGSGPLMRWLIRFTSGRLDGVAVLGANLRGIYQGLVPAARVSVVPNGTADLFGDTPTATTADGHSNGPVTVTYLGALYQPKGIVDFVIAAGLLHRNRPALRFVAAGSWFSVETRRVVEAEAERQGLEEAIRFPGVVAGADKLALLRDTDVLVFPGIQAEGQPYVILEAMAAGVAVVSTSRGAIEDMVVDGETGFLVPDRDPAAIAAAVERLVDDPALRARLGRAGRRRFLERFTDERSLQTQLEWLRRVGGTAAGREPAAGQPARREATP